MFNRNDAPPGQAAPSSEGWPGSLLKADNIGHLAWMHARDTSLVLVSRARQEKSKREPEGAHVPPPRQGRGLRISIPGMLALVAAAAAAMVVYRRVSEKVDERPSLIAKYDKTAPVADGVIGPKEYGPVVFVQWTEGNTLTAFRRELHDPTKSPIPGAWNFGIKLEKRWLSW
jgi:hypothetical protein